MRKGKTFFTANLRPSSAPLMWGGPGSPFSRSCWGSSSRAAPSSGNHLPPWCGEGLGLPSPGAAEAPQAGLHQAQVTFASWRWGWSVRWLFLSLLWLLICFLLPFCIICSIYPYLYSYLCYAGVFWRVLFPFFFFSWKIFHEILYIFILAIYAWIYSLNSTDLQWNVSFLCPTGWSLSKNIHLYRIPFGTVHIRITGGWRSSTCSSSIRTSCAWDRSPWMPSRNRATTSSLKVIVSSYLSRFFESWLSYLMYKLYFNRMRSNCKNYAGFWWTELDL